MLTDVDYRLHCATVALRAVPPVCGFRTLGYVFGVDGGHTDDNAIPGTEDQNIA
jgi:hypothetical protein